MGYGYGKHSLDVQAHRETFEIIDLSPERVSEYVEESQEKLQKVRHLYNVKSPAAAVEPRAA